MKILAALFDHRGAEFSVSELAHVTDVAIATASREVERLEAHGIVRSRNVGRSRFVSANWDLPWAAALATILAHTAGLPARLGSTRPGSRGGLPLRVLGGPQLRRDRASPSRHRPARDRHPEP